VRIRHDHKTLIWFRYIKPYYRLKREFDDSMLIAFWVAGWVIGLIFSGLAVFLLMSFSDQILQFLTFRFSP
jgi:hypothetical protein